MSDETLKPEKPINDTLRDTAAGHGIILDEDRLDKLASQASHFADMRRNGEKVAYVDNGLMIAPPTEVADTGRMIAELHFLPKTPRATRGATYAQPEHRTRIMRDGLRSFQDYALLIEAGYIDAPDQLVGNTSKELARVSERIGFQQAPDGFHVVADTAMVCGRVVSPEMVQMEEALTQRLASSLGGSAISGMQA